MAHNPDRVDIIFRAPEEDKPELVIIVKSEKDGEPPQEFIKPLSFEKLRLVVRQASECLMRYPVRPESPPAA